VVWKADRVDRNTWSDETMRTLEATDPNIKRGDMVYEIFTDNMLLYIDQRPVKALWRLTRVITTALEPYQGIKFDAFGQFNQSYRDSSVRGNHLHMYRMYSTEGMLQHDIIEFLNRFRKRTGITLGYPIWLN